MEQYLKVSQAARELGCSAEWLRAAELRGKIPPAKRDINGWRVYSLEDLETIRVLLAPRLPSVGADVG